MFQAPSIDNFADTKTVLTQSTPANPIPDDRFGKFVLNLGN